MEQGRERGKEEKIFVQLLVNYKDFCYWKFLLLGEQQMIGKVYRSLKVDNGSSLTQYNKDGEDILVLWG